MLLNQRTLFCAFSSVLFAISGCTGDGSQGTVGEIPGYDMSSGTPVSKKPTEPNPAPTEGPSGTLGPSCRSDDNSRFCVALKYVVYKDSNDRPVVSEQEAISNLAAVNAVFSKCQIAFQIDEFVPAEPSRYGLTFNTANSSELDIIRRAFQDDSEMVVVTTGDWNRSGSLGSTGANAWTNMPGMGLYGVILEDAVGTYPNLIAHELGHYVNLDHSSDASNLMSPIIYTTSTGLTAGQCSAARDALNSFWPRMLR